MTQLADLDAERQIIAAALHRPSTLDDLHHLRPGDFHDPRHEHAWHVIRRLHHDGRPIDPITVAAALKADPDALPGMDTGWVAGIYGGLVSAESAVFHATRVRDYADLRNVQAAATRMHQAADSGRTAAEAKAAARVILDALDTRDAGAVTVADVIDQVLDEAETGPRDVRPTPWPELDEATTGLRPGTVTVVGARPGKGKSVLAMNLAWHVARGGSTALTFSLEMSRVEVTRRLAAAVSSVNYGRLLRGGLNDRDWQRVAAARAGIEGVPFVIDDRSGITVDEIAATSRHHARVGTLGLVVVDYIGLVSPRDRRTPREQQVAEASRALKILAGDLHVPVVVLSQLNRGPEARTDKHPTMSDLRESGSVEQDADVILLLHRDDEQSPDRLEVGVAKNRFGAPGMIHLDWEGHYQRATSPLAKHAHRRGAA